MKTFLLMISIVILVSFILFQWYTTMSTAKSGAQAYQVLRTEKDFEIRFYPAVTMATIISSAKTYKALGSSGFQKLAGYIFGKNDRNQKIAMTSPVHMDINDSTSTMSFVMPTGFQKDNLPQPNDPEVKIETSADEYVAAIRFGGFASDEQIKTYTAKLETALKANGISYYGHFRFLGYNPPFQLFGRKNEIIVSVNQQ